MREQILKTEEISARLLSCNTVIVGTGAAGYNAADRLWELGQQDILIVTENRMRGRAGIQEVISRLIIN